MALFLFIRHGESEANEKGFFAGQLDVRLSENGLVQAKKTAEYIKNTYKPDLVFASDLQRAYITGKCVADILGLEVKKSEAFREINAGDWQGKSFDFLQENFKEEYGIWLSDIGNARPTNGEAVCELKDRFLNALLEIAEKNPDKTIVVATHATPIRILETLTKHKSLDKMKDVPWVSNSSVSGFSYNNGEWKCEMISEDSHLGDLKTVFPKNV